MEIGLWLWLPFLTAFFIALVFLGAKEVLDRQRNKERGIDSVVHPPPRERIIDDLYVLDRPEGPREVMSLMTVKEVMDILNANPSSRLLLICVFVRKMSMIDRMGLLLPGNGLKEIKKIEKPGACWNA